MRGCFWAWSLAHGGFKTRQCECACEGVGECVPWVETACLSTASWLWACASEGALQCTGFSPELTSFDPYILHVIGSHYSHFTD